MSIVKESPEEFIEELQPEFEAIVKKVNEIRNSKGEGLDDKVEEEEIKLIVSQDIYAYRDGKCMHL